MNLTKYFKNMHYVAIAVLLVVAVVSNFGHGFPVNLAKRKKTTRQAQNNVYFVNKIFVGSV